MQYFILALLTACATALYAENTSTESQKPSPYRFPTQHVDIQTNDKPVSGVTQKATYYHPGMLTYVNGKWEGTDNLFNLQNSLDVHISILKPPHDQLKVSVDDLYKLVNDVLKTAKISTTLTTPLGQPPLPVLVFKILLFPIDDGYAGFISGKLFEAVEPLRLKLEKDQAFQAVTWQRNELFVSFKEDTVDEIRLSIKDIAESFVQIYNAYLKRRVETYRFSD